MQENHADMGETVTHAEVVKLLDALAWRLVGLDLMAHEPLGGVVKTVVKPDNERTATVRRKKITDLEI